MTDRDDLMALYKGLVRKFDGLEIKGKKMPYTSMNGNMFSFLSPQGDLCVRLGEADCAAYLKANDLQPVMQYNAVMRGYVPVPSHVLSDPAALTDLFDSSVDHARALKPKPTKR